jgi:hypothetical protein
MRNDTTIEFTVEATPVDVFTTIVDVRAWGPGDIEGPAGEPGGGPRHGGPVESSTGDRPAIQAGELPSKPAADRGHAAENSESHIP